MQNDEINLTDVKNNQEKFKSYLEEIKKRKQKTQIKREKKHFAQHLNALQSKKQSY